MRITYNIERIFSLVSRICKITNQYRADQLVLDHKKSVWTGRILLKNSEFCSHIFYDQDLTVLY